MAARSSAEGPVTDTVWVGAVTFLVFGYLLYALLVPEKF
jgi:K+-transporting ATPase KdpF subunit